MLEASRVAVGDQNNYGLPHGATAEDAVASAQVLEAMTRSAQTGRWTRAARAR